MVRGNLAYLGGHLEQVANLMEIEPHRGYLGWSRSDHAHALGTIALDWRIHVPLPGSSRHCLARPCWVEVYQQGGLG